jgi:hypothetical protein
MPAISERMSNAQFVSFGLAWNPNIKGQAPWVRKRNRCQQAKLLLRKSLIPKEARDAIRVIRHGPKPSACLWSGTKAADVRDPTGHGIALIAEIFLREQSRWQPISNRSRDWWAAARPGLTQYLARDLPLFGRSWHRGDTDGTAVVMAAVLDQWYEDRDTISLDQVPG